MKYPFALIFCAMLSACGGGSGSAGDSASTGFVGTATYSGTGIGVWRYDNTSASAASINVNITGLSAGKTATLVFSNGSVSTATLPDSGTLASSVSAAALADAGISLGTASAQHQHAQEAAHAGMLEKNRALAAGLIRQRLAAGPAADLTSRPMAAAASLSFPPAVGTSRSWNDNFDGSPVVYTTTVKAVCALPSGRHVVWWVDPNIISSGTFSSSGWSAAFNRLQASYCGDSGGLARINSLLGDVWGGESAFHPDYIQDSSVLQDVNVVVLDVPASSQWAGYFFGEDTKTKASSANSNAALAFFINASQVANDIDFATSTLLHESTHMVNFYQRAVARSVVHDTWLEETTAMMTEDIVAPAVIGGYNKALSERLPVYLATGGDVSYINWPKLTSASANYALGAGFGAFLNRRYGLSIYQQLVGSCGNGVAATSTLSSQECLNGVIKANGGDGFGDEFARFGTTLFGRFPAVGAPSGYGYPAKTAGSYSLQAKDLSLLPLASPATPTSGYQATSHLFQRDTVSAGSSYVRNGVVVPANTSLTVIIQ